MVIGGCQIFSKMKSIFILFSACSMLGMPEKIIVFLPSKSQAMLLSESEKAEFFIKVHVLVVKEGIKISSI